MNFSLKKIKKYYELLNYYEGVIKDIEGILSGLEKVVLKGLVICLISWQLLNLNINYSWNYVKQWHNYIMK